MPNSLVCARRYTSPKCFNTRFRDKPAFIEPVQLPLDESEGWFTLLNSSFPSWTHSQFGDVYGPIPEIVWNSPVDAVSLGIKNGDDVTIFNELGAITVEAGVTENVSTGVL